MFGFAGLEGSGQGLLLRACAGLEDCDHGEIIVDGKLVHDLSYHARREEGLPSWGPGGWRKD